MPDLNGSFLFFLKNLELTKREVQRINKAQYVIRNHLARNLQAYALSKAGGRVKVTPRFFIQGSWAYKTLVLPYHAPPQNMDIDLGVYLPVSYLENRVPSLAARGFFDQVEFLLGQLAGRHRWKIDLQKETCTCLVLNGRLHIDVPLYSIPDKDFRAMAAVALRRGLVKKLKKFDFKLVEGNMDLWAELPSKRVMLALRKGDWQESDPRRLHKWFVGQVLKKGEQLRRVCRYVKAWRDKLWKKGGPSSLFLMVICVKAFKAAAGRDDLALLKVLRQIPKALKEPVRVPRVIPDNLAKLQKPGDMRRLEKQALRFSQDLSGAIQSRGSLGAAQSSVARHLGSRFPGPKPIKHLI